MIKYFFLDFAETLGFRPIPEVDIDLNILSEVIDLKNHDLRGKYIDFCQNNNLYDRTLSFTDFQSEFDFTVKHFDSFIQKILLISDSESRARHISETKYNTLAHRLYEDAATALENYRLAGEVYILSDGRPSRRKTLDLLGIKNYCNEYFISDEIGFIKSEKDFYKIVLEKTNCAGDIYFFDDLIKNLDTFSEVVDLKGVLVDRKGLVKQEDVKYKLVHELPVPLCH